MSRTKRAKSYHFLRRIKTRQPKRVEMGGVEEMRSEGFHTPPRQCARGGGSNKKIPDAWDDYKVAGRDEMDYHKQKRGRMNVWKELY